MLESLDNGKPISASKSGDLPQVSMCTAPSLLQSMSPSQTSDSNLVCTTEDHCGICSSEWRMVRFRAPKPPDLCSCMRQGCCLQSIEHIRYYAGWADKIHGKVIPTGGPIQAISYREPLGRWLAGPV